LVKEKSPENGIQVRYQRYYECNLTSTSHFPPSDTQLLGTFYAHLEEVREKGGKRENKLLTKSYKKSICPLKWSTER
jgi:hypothetical protein